MDLYSDNTARSALSSAKTNALLGEVKGTTSGTISLKNLRLDNPASYPQYEVVTANGVTDVIEYRRPEPILYITDAVWSELGAGTPPLPKIKKGRGTVFPAPFTPTETRRENTSELVVHS
jgi:hypothetical protein